MARRSSFRTARGSAGTGRGGSTNAAIGTGCLAVVVLGVLWAVVSFLLKVLAAAFSTIWPWLIIAFAGIAYGAHRTTKLLRRQQLEKRFFDAIDAVGSAGIDPMPLLTQLEAEAPEQADVYLLRAAHAAHIGRIEDALTAIHITQQRSMTLGRLSGGLALRFPGLLAPLPFHSPDVRRDALTLARNHLLVVGGRAREVVASVSASIQGPLRTIQLATMAEAFMATGDPTRAVAALEQAVAEEASPSVARGLRYMLARGFEAKSAPDRAFAEYTRVLHDGDYRDARERRESLAADNDEVIFQRVLSRLQQARNDGERQNILDGGLREVHLETTRERLRREAELGKQAEQARIRAEEEQREDDAIHRAVVKIEAARGPAGRRSALEAGLREVTIPQKRDRLLAEASRIEVEAVLDKVDGLKTVAAKKRNLQVALDAIRNDEIPDELQAKQIQWLEDALAELEGSAK